MFLRAFFIEKNIYKCYINFMKEQQNLDELLDNLPEQERQKFDYILNFYTREHVLYNFNTLREELSNYTVLSCANFKRPLEPKLKEIADTFDVSTLLGNFQSVRTHFFETESKAVSDFLLYLLDYTDLPDSRKINTISELRKYKDLVKEGYISAEDVSKTLSEFFSKKIAESDSIDWAELEDEYNFELIKIVKYNTILLDNLEEDDHSSSSILSYDLENALAKVDRKAAFRKQGGLSTKDISIVFLKYIAGDEFESLDHATIERIKAMLNSFGFKDLKRADIDLLRENFEAIRYRNLSVAELYYIKNIVANDDALRAYEQLPEDLQEQVLKLNIVATPEEITNVMNALNFCREERAEGERETFPNTKYQFSKLPPEKREQLLELIKEEPLREYKKKIGLYHPITFGFELETDNVSDKVVKNLVVQKRLGEQIVKKQGLKRGITPRWAVDYDGTVLHGVEVISPVMKDTPEDWDSLKEVCSFLKSVGGKATNSCGGHIHIGADILGSNESAWNNFFKTWSASEPIIYKMSNKAGEAPRTGTLNEAGPTKPIIDEILASGGVTIKGSSDVVKLADTYTRRFLQGEFSANRSKGLNLCPIAEGKQNTIEFRIPNGNLDHIEIQRTAEFYARMLDVARMMAENPEFKQNIFSRLQTGKTEEEKMVYLVDLLFDKTIDKAVFYERYFSKPRELEIGGKKYEDVISSDVDIKKNARYEWRGYRS